MLASFAPEGRSGCSHGWSAAGTPARATRGTRPQNEDRPEGAEETWEGGWRPRLAIPPPLRGGFLSAHLSTGCTGRRTGCAPPVATILRPSGATFWDSLKSD